MAIGMRKIEREGYPELIECDEGSNHRSPQAEDQEDGRRGRDEISGEDDWLAGSREETAHAERNKCDADTEPQQQKAKTGPTTRKSGE